MNKTHELVVRALLDYADGCPGAERAAARKNVARAHELARSRQAEYVAGENTWEAFAGVWDYLNALFGVVRLLDIEDAGERHARINMMRAALDDGESMLRIVFFVQEYSLWPSYRTLYEYFSARGDCVIDLVYIYESGSLPDKGRVENINAYRADGYNVIDMQDYPLSEADPDIAFYMKPYYKVNGAPEKFYIQEVSRHIRYTNFISYCLDVQGGIKLVKFFYALPMFKYAWRVFTYSNFYHRMQQRYSYCDGANLVQMGHPKFDGVAQLMASHAVRRNDWDAFIAGRPVVMWNTHFSVHANNGVGTFFEYKDLMMEYVKDHDDFVLLWRPHPYFWQQVTTDPRYVTEQVDAYIEEMESLGNVIVDRGGDYRPSFATANALVSDATTFLVEFGITGKPVLYTPKRDGERIINDDYLGGIDICRSGSDIVAFVDQCRAKVHIYPERKAFFEREFGACDGCNGERIGAYVLDSVERDCRERAIQIVREGKDRL